MDLIKDFQRQQKEFRPFDIALHIDNEAEAILLWHVLIRNNLREVLFQDPDYSRGYFKFYCAECFAGTEKQIDPPHLYDEE